MHTARPRRTRRPRLRRAAPYAAAVVLLGAGLVGATAVAAARTPGNEPFEARWADWLRGHHLAALVAPLEQVYYDHKAPSAGGRPVALNPLPPAPSTTSTTSTTAATAPGAKRPGASTTEPGLRRVRSAGLPAPTALPLLVTPGLPGEGQWVAVGDPVGGRAAMYETQFRADTTYTSQITSAVWIDPTVARVALVPGSTEPGGAWSTPPFLSGPAESAALAAFNGGFRFADAHGGFFLNGRTAVPLRTGAASVVIDSSGKVDVGTWGGEVNMAPTTTAVLQNLVPIVDNGQPAPAATYNDTAIWGATLKSSTVVARSAVGVTASGAVVYVAGPALSARTLAESLVRAGAVRAMALDINPEWVTFNFFTHDAATGATAATKLYPGMQRSADRYLGPTSESRDFFTVSIPS